MPVAGGHAIWRKNIVRDSAVELCKAASQVIVNEKKTSAWEAPGFLARRWSPVPRLLDPGPGESRFGALPGPQDPQRLLPLGTFSLYWAGLKLQGALVSLRSD